MLGEADDNVENMIASVIIDSREILGNAIRQLCGAADAEVRAAIMQTLREAVAFFEGQIEVMVMVADPNVKTPLGKLSEWQLGFSSWRF